MRYMTQQFILDDGNACGTTIRYVCSLVPNRWIARDPDRDLKTCVSMILTRAS